MAIAHDATTAFERDGSDPTPSFNHTVGAGADRILLVAVATGGGTAGQRAVTGVTYGGVALTRVFAKDDANFLNVETWYLIAPTAGTAGVIADLGGNPGLCAVGASSYTGVDQTTPLRTPATASGSSATASVAVGSASGDVVFGAIASDSEAGITETGTLRWEFENQGSDCSWGAQQYAGAASVTVQWSQSATGWTVGGVSMIPVGGAAAAATPPPPAFRRVRGRKAQKRREPK